MRRAALILLTLAAAASVSHAQDHPNFSGTWTIVPDRSVWLDVGHPVNIRVFGDRFTAEQSATTLTIAIDNDNGFKWVYRLDGTPSENLPPGPTGVQHTVSTIAWSGSELLITTNGSVVRNGKTEAAETKRTMKFNPDGRLLVQAPWGRNGEMIGSAYSKVQ